MHCCIISILIDKLEGRVVDQNTVKQKLSLLCVQIVCTNDFFQGHQEYAR